MTTLEDSREADKRSTSNAEPIVSSNEYEVSNLYDSSLALPEEQDGILQPVMHILREDTSEAEDFDASLSDSEKYKLVDDMSEDFTVDPVDLQESTDSEDSDIRVEKKTPLVTSARKQYTFHEYTQTSSSKNLVVKRMDESSGPVVCRWNDCNTKFDSPEDLSKHLDFQHDLSDWICHWTPCSRDLKPFDARYKLIVHLRCHTGEKPYKCTIPGCLRRFSRIENMRLHVRTHTGEKPYACGYEGCPKRFNNSSDRAKHVKTHIQTKPYKCKFPGCDKHYTDPSSMRKHFRSIHFRNEQGKQNKNNLKMHDYSTALPAKQPRIAPGPAISSTIVSPLNSAGLMETQTNSTSSQMASTAMINSNSNNNGNNKFVQVPVFQLPINEPSPGESDMSQLIQEGKVQPILLQNGSQQSMLIFVPTANMHEGIGSGVTMIPVLSQTQQTKPPPQNTPVGDSFTNTTMNTSDKLSTEPSEPMRPAKNVRVIVSSGRSKEQDDTT